MCFAHHVPGLHTRLFLCASLCQRRGRGRLCSPPSGSRPAGPVRSISRKVLNAAVNLLLLAVSRTTCAIRMPPRGEGASASVCDQARVSARKRRGARGPYHSFLPVLPGLGKQHVGRGGQTHLPAHRQLEPLPSRCGNSNPQTATSAMQPVVHRSMTLSLQRGGPPGQGVWLVEREPSSWLLGHCRHSRALAARSTQTKPAQDCTCTATRVRASP